ncbi:MAG TPA: iron ABC transporter ATP-binding protein, partial [Methanosarcina sp.]|nr:iron ABC transporter ATP-binding protein [Methanosarcina sp.]
RYTDRFILLKDGKAHAHGGAEVITPHVIEEVYGLPAVIGEIAGMQHVVPSRPGMIFTHNL